MTECFYDQVTFIFRGETNINVDCIQQQGGKENERNITLNLKKYTDITFASGKKIIQR